MRLLESVQYPLPGPVSIYGTVLDSKDISVSNLLGAITIKSGSYGSSQVTVGVSAPASYDASLCQPKPGRTFTVDRVGINPINVSQSGNGATGPTSLSINFQLIQNGAIVSDVLSLVYESPATPTADLTLQNTGNAVQPFQSLELLPGDSLSVRFSCGYSGANLPSLAGVLFKASFSLVAVGENSELNASRK